MLRRLISSFGGRGGLAFRKKILRQHKIIVFPVEGGGDGAGVMEAGAGGVAVLSRKMCSSCGCIT